ncbi:MAG: endonuclease/exonuclease/phosphatase family protein [Acidobacteriota bacterium]
MIAGSGLLGGAPLGAVPTQETAAQDTAAQDTAAQETGTGTTVRVAVFNVWELSLTKLDEVDSEGRGAHPQLLAAAEILQRVRPDIVLINEIDYDPERDAVRRFQDRYLAVPQGGQDPIRYPHVVYEPVNTGVPSGLDLSGDGDADDPEDAWGFGRYPGQYGMAVLSRFETDSEALRTFQMLRWSSLPGHLMPDGREGRPAWYGPEAADRLRLSSKSHWDVSVRIGGRILHILAAHPTPPVFDGDEDRNGRRNFDEIRLWGDYLTGGDAASWIVDDRGRRGGLSSGAPFVILGDYNADPVRDSGPYGQPAIDQLLKHPRVRDPKPKGDGDQGEDRPYAGDSRTRTSAYGRIDYALPSRNLDVVGSGVFLPPAESPLRPLVAGDGRASDHQLVWVDLRWETPR